MVDRHSFRAETEALPTSWRLSSKSAWFIAVRPSVVFHRREIGDVLTGRHAKLGFCPGCAREGVFGLQAAGASHWAAGRYSSIHEHDSAIWIGGEAKF